MVERIAEEKLTVYDVGVRRMTSISDPLEDPLEIDERSIELPLYSPARVIVMPQ